MHHILDHDFAASVLGSEIAEIFLGQARTLPTDAIALMKREVSDYLAVIRHGLRDNEFLDITLAERITRACCELLDAYPRLSEDERAAVVGAVRYFVMQEDADDDLESILGLEDDAQVLNYVIERLGIDVSVIELEE